MTEAGTLLSTSAGVALIGLVGRDAFDALFHAEGRGTFSRQLTRAVWWVFRRAGRTTRARVGACLLASHARRLPL